MHPRTCHTRAQGVLAALVVSALCFGCLDEPEIEKRWTILDVESSSLDQFDELTAASTDITLDASVTYRDLLTGGYIAEVRVSADLALDDVRVGPDVPRLEMTHDIEMILQNSVTAGREIQLVTGWDHLIQHMSFAFTANVPARVPTAEGGMAAPTSAYLLLYLGEVDEIRLEDGRDSLVVTPFTLDRYEVLMTGYELLLPGQTLRSGVMR
jgi:hypothetical protein